MHPCMTCKNLGLLFGAYDVPALYVPECLTECRFREDFSPVQSSGVLL
jgi:hypothetical protein